MSGKVREQEAEKNARVMILSRSGAMREVSPRRKNRVSTQMLNDMARTSGKSYKLTAEDRQEDRQENRK